MRSRPQSAWGEVNVLNSDGCSFSCRVGSIQGHPPPSRALPVACERASVSCCPPTVWCSPKAAAKLARERHSILSCPQSLNSTKLSLWQHITQRGRAPSTERTLRQNVCDSLADEVNKTPATTAGRRSRPMSRFASCSCRRPADW